MRTCRDIFSILLVVVVISCSHHLVNGVPVQQVVPSDPQLSELETGMLRSAASYIFGRWLTTGTTSTSAPPADVAVTTAAPAPVASTPVPLPPKRARGTDMIEATSSPFMNLFMILIRALLDSNASSQPAPAPSAKQTQRCNCGTQQAVPAPQQQRIDPVQSSLSQAAMKAILMVVSDVLSKQLSSNSVSSTSSGYFW